MLFPKTYEKMKIYPPLILLLCVLFACTESKQQLEETLPDKVAKAYGIEKFDEIKSIAYTWNVQRDSVSVFSRRWTWDIQSRQVTYAGSDTTFTYSLDLPADQLPEVNQGFINDKYWLMMPFQLAWDTGYTYEITESVPSPIKGNSSTKLTILYNSEDGYTPGDAYDLYVDENHRLLAWTFRKKNSPEGKSWTWEGEQEVGPIRLALDHFDSKGERFIWFSDVQVE